MSRTASLEKTPDAFRGFSDLGRSSVKDCVAELIPGTSGPEHRLRAQHRRDESPECSGESRIKSRGRPKIQTPAARAKRQYNPQSRRPKSSADECLS
jgi:hypothetical protein